MHRWKMAAIAALACCLIIGCKNDAPTTVPDNKPTKQVSIPPFQRDSAFSYVVKQVNFGPRNLGSEGHEATRQWIVDKLKACGLEVIEQNFPAQIANAGTYEATNIIAKYNPGVAERVLMAAHWDTRYIAEKDTDIEDRDDPILGADDGASGVAVLLEIARVVSENPLDLGIDFVFFDAEDQGTNGGSTDSWCLGSQYWSRNLPAGQRPTYGILLDMVGAKGATFPKEGISMHYAPDIVAKVWQLGQSMGYGHYFVNTRATPITDDHQFVNDLTGIPMIDIINYPNGSFGHYHHTSDDDMDVIDRNTLRAVGQVVLALLYKESVGAI
ncbi:MAG: DUF4910 domain-containing protein [Saprospiraceae bacterium]|nr:DUF4910 domain-containing protein [Saprospiraceae bacterium]